MFRVKIYIQSFSIALLIGQLLSTLSLYEISLYGTMANDFQTILFRNSRTQLFFKIVVLKNFAIFTEKHLCWSLFLAKPE